MENYIKRALDKRSMDATKAQVKYMKSLVRTIKGWPKKGVAFQDITTLLKDPQGFHIMTKALADRYKTMKIDAVVGIESRGFITASALAYALGAGFIPFRKRGKLPAEVISASYHLEYGRGYMEVHTDAINRGMRILIADDLLATGGTSLAACSLVERLGGEVIECCFIICRPDLGGREKLRIEGYREYSLIEF